MTHTSGVVSTKVGILFALCFIATRKPCPGMKPPNMKLEENRLMEDKNI